MQPETPSRGRGAKRLSPSIPIRPGRSHSAALSTPMHSSRLCCSASTTRRPVNSADPSRRSGRADGYLSGDLLRSSRTGRSPSRRFPRVIRNSRRRDPGPARGQRTRAATTPEFAAALVREPDTHPAYRAGDRDRYLLGHRRPAAALGAGTPIRRGRRVDLVAAQFGRHHGHSRSGAQPGVNGDPYELFVDGPAPTHIGGSADFGHFRLVRTSTWSIGLSVRGHRSRGTPATQC